MSFRLSANDALGRKGGGFTAADARPSRSASERLARMSAAAP